jgi:hypothetical protein
VLSDEATWVQLTLAEFTPACAAHVRYRVWLALYDTGGVAVYLDNALYG